MPAILVTGQNSAITAAVVINSDGVDTSGLGFILNGTEIALSGTLGTVAPATVGTLGGVVGSVYTAGATLGMGSATAVLDNQTVTTPIEIVIPVELMRFSVDAYGDYLEVFGRGATDSVMRQVGRTVASAMRRSSSSVGKKYLNTQALPHNPWVIDSRTP